MKDTAEITSANNQGKTLQIRQQKRSDAECNQKDKYSLPFLCHSFTPWVKPMKMQQK